MMLPIAGAGWAVLSKAYIRRLPEISEEKERKKAQGNARRTAAGHVVLTMTLVPVAWLVFIPSGFESLSWRSSMELIPLWDTIDTLRLVDSWDSTYLWQLI